MAIISLLHDTHVLVLMADRRTGSTLARIFQSMGATVHSASSQNEAIGLYWRLFRAGIRPRVVVTSWSLTPQDSNEYKYLEMIGREEIDGTALNLLVNIIDLDPTAFLTVYTQDPVQAQEILNRSGIDAEVFSRQELEPVEFAVRIATHPGISTQRIDAAEIESEIHASESHRKLTTRSSCELRVQTPRVQYG
jgi:hypothetical protein